MPSVRIRNRVLAALLGLGALASAAAGPAGAAGARIVRPETDANAPAPPAATTVAPQGGPRALPLNPMRETMPGVYEGIVPVRLPDGSWSVDLDERFHAYSVARLGPGGRLGGTCVLGAGALARWQGSACLHDHAAAVAGVVRPRVTGPATSVVTKWEAR